MKASLGEQNERFAVAMARAGASFGPRAAPAHRVAPIAAVAPGPRSAAPSPDAIALGVDEYGRELALDLAKLATGRLLIQGVSGAGKSWLLRRLLEQSAGRIQQIVIDPEGEFDTLAEGLGYLYVEASKLDTAALATLGQRVREHRLSVVLDFSDWDREGQMKALAAFMGALIEAPREFWTPAIVAIDEAHLLAPYGGADLAPASVRKNSIAAIADLQSRGRKRGLIGVIATQRLARLAKSAASDAQNFLVGMNTLDLDIKRASEMIGWPPRKGFDRLPLLQPGSFVAVGAAFSRAPAIANVGGVKSRHKGAAPALAPLRQRDAAEARQALKLYELIEESAEPRPDDAFVGVGFRAVRDFVREPSFALASRVYAALVPVAPDGALCAALADALSVSEVELADAVSLLCRFRIVERSHIDGDLALRVEPGLLRWGKRP